MTALRDFLPPGALPRIVPFAAYIVVLAAINLLHPDQVLPLTFYPLIAGSAFVALVVFRRSYAELRRPWATPSQIAVAVAAGLVVLAIWVGVDTPLLRFAESKGYAPVGAEGQVLWGWVAVRTAGSTLIVPIMEELFWRSFLMRWLDARDFLSVVPQAVSWRSLLFSCLPFALEHRQVFAGFVAGLAYALIYKLTGRLWPAIVAHAVSNLGLGMWIVVTHQWSYW